MKLLLIGKNCKNKKLVKGKTYQVSRASGLLFIEENGYELVIGKYLDNGSLQFDYAIITSVDGEFVD